jgi:type IV pilus assembly protein PilV
MNPRRHARGLTLIEVLVALVVISIGLLGIAKMQALSIASTRVSSMRSLIAIEAASIASAMHANSSYWRNVTTSPSDFTASSGANSSGAFAMTSSDTAMAAQTTVCLNPSAGCTASQMAAYDLTQWGQAIMQVMPTANGRIDCSGSATTPANPVTCSITVQWIESYVGMNAATQYTSAAATQTLTYNLVVQP